MESLYVCWPQILLPQLVLVPALIWFCCIVCSFASRFDPISQTRFRLSGEGYHAAVLPFIT